MCGISSDCGQQDIRRLQKGGHNKLQQWVPMSTARASRDKENLGLSSNVSKYTRRSTGHTRTRTQAVFVQHSANTLGIRRRFTVLLKPVAGPNMCDATSLRDCSTVPLASAWAPANSRAHPAVEKGAHQPCALSFQMEQ